MKIHITNICLGISTQFIRKLNAFTVFCDFGRILPTEDIFCLFVLSGEILFSNGRFFLNVSYFLLYSSCLYIALKVANFLKARCYENNSIVSGIAPIV